MKIPARDSIIDTPNVDLAARKHVYAFMAREEAIAEESETEAHLQVVQYLGDKNENYTLLKKYTMIEKLFFKYNAGTFI